VVDGNSLERWLTTNIPEARRHWVERGGNRRTTSDLMVGFDTDHASELGMRPVPGLRLENWLD
jgi:hypothetical protein